MNYVESFNLLGIEAKQIPSITGEGTPTSTTEAAVGSLYMDTTTGDMYKCTAATDGVYTWARTLDENDKNELAENIEGKFDATNVVQTTGDSETAVMSQKATTEELREVIQPNILPELPYKVYRQNGRYFTEDILNAMEIDAEVEIWVDSANGNNSNSGLSKDAPVKTLKQAFTIYRNADVNGIIRIADGSTFHQNDLPIGASDCVISHNLAIVCDGECELFGGTSQTYSAYSDVVYVSNGSTASAGACVDSGNVDPFGLFVPLTKKATLDEVTAEAGSWCLIDNKTYIHPADNTNVANCKSLGTVKPLRIDFRSATQDVKIYLRGLNVVGNVEILGASADTNYNHQFIAENCKFQHGWSNVNAVMLNDFMISYFIGCTGGYSALDVYNYHYLNTPQNKATQAVAVEVNCLVEEAGFYDTSLKNTHNLSTIHDAANILRCNTRGMNAPGPMIADVNGSHSVLLDCEVLNIKIYDGLSPQNAAIQFKDDGTLRAQKAIVQNSNGYDVREGVLYSVSGVDVCVYGVDLQKTNISNPTLLAKKI